MVLNKVIYVVGKVVASILFVLLVSGGAPPLVFAAEPAPTPAPMEPTTAASVPVAEPMMTELNPMLALNIATSYILGLQDAVELSVWQRPEFLHRLPIRPDGKITVDLIGDVQAAGLTPMQLSQDIQKRLTEYVVNPQVSIVVAEFRSKKVFVQGEINRPGEVIIKGQLTVMEAISGAGSPTKWANLHKVKVVRGDLKHPVIIPIDARAIMLKGDTKQNILLQNGDVVFVPPYGLVKIGYAADILFYPLTSIFRYANFSPVSVR